MQVHTARQGSLNNAARAVMMGALYRFGILSVTVTSGAQNILSRTAAPISLTHAWEGETLRSIVSNAACMFSKLTHQR